MGNLPRSDLLLQEFLLAVVLSAFYYVARWMRGLAPAPANKTLEALRLLFMFAAVEGTAGLLLPPFIPAWREWLRPTDRQVLVAKANALWHTDSSFKKTPALASVLSRAAAEPTMARVSVVAGLLFASAPMMSVFPILGQRFGLEERCAASLVGCTVLAFFSVSILLVLLRWQGLLPG